MKNVLHIPVVLIVCNTYRCASRIVPKQHSIWAPVGPRLGQVGPNWDPFLNSAWVVYIMLIMSGRTNVCDDAAF